MKKNQLLAVLALASPMMAHASGWYAGLDVGSAQTEAKIDEYALFGDTTARASDTTVGFRVRGGYQFGKYFALEVAYVDFGEVEYHFDPDDCPFGAPGPCPFNVRTSMNGYVGTLRGILPIGEHWFLDARLGIGKMNFRAHEIGGASTSASDDNEAGHYGIGGGYRFKGGWEAVFDYSEYVQSDWGSLGGNSGSYKLGENSVTSLGLSYRW